MSQEEKDLLKITQDYYDSSDADEFYHQIWGGEDIHIGLYQDQPESIKEASKRTVAKMATLLNDLDQNTQILDIGSGYGGAARYLAQNFGVQVDCLNLSYTENQRNTEKTKEANLSDLVKVNQGNFEQIPFPDANYDVVWSQDALLHSNQKPQVFAEVNRVLKSGGVFIFTDPMQRNEASPEVLQPVLQRIHLEEMGSVRLYEQIASDIGLEKSLILEMPQELIRHYQAVLSTLSNSYEEMCQKASKDYIDKMMKGLNHWIEAGQKGYLNWGILLFKKP